MSRTLGVQAVRFDPDVAEALRRALDEAESVLRLQASWRGAGVRNALRDFAGGYADVFRVGNVIESEDRLRLAETLDDVSSQVEQVSVKAAEEQKRRHDLAAWREREARRQRDRAAGADLWQPLYDVTVQVFDPKPSEDPVRARPLDADFLPRRRDRHAHSSAGRSSADPEVLRAFAAQLRANIGRVEQEMVRVKGEWYAFLSECSWAPVESDTFVAGFEWLLAEDREDADWLDRIAAAFEGAGGPVSNATLDLAATSALPSAFLAVMRPGMTPEEVNAAWEASGLSETDVKALRGTTDPAALEVLVTLANLPGLPATVADIAAREVLAAAQDHRKKTAFRALGLLEPGDQIALMLTPAAGRGQVETMTMVEFDEQIAALQLAVSRADAMSAKADKKIASLVLGISVHDGALVAATSLGNPDTATVTKVNVPGATTTLKSMSNMTDAASTLYDGTSREYPDESVAIVSWNGYRAPAPDEVMLGNRAESGAERFARFIDGLYASHRADRMNMSVLAHSYGSTMSAEALTMTKNRIDNFATYGSAGIPLDIDPEDINAEHKYATQAATDWLPQVGYGLWRTNPRMLAGFETFSSDGGNGTLPVQGHDMYSDEPGEVRYLSEKSSSERFLVELGPDDGGMP